MSPSHTASLQLHAHEYPAQVNQGGLTYAGRHGDIAPLNTCHVPVDESVTDGEAASSPSVYRLAATDPHTLQPTYNATVVQHNAMAPDGQASAGPDDTHSLCPTSHPDHATMLHEAAHSQDKHAKRCYTSCMQYASASSQGGDTHSSQYGNSDRYDAVHSGWLGLCPSDTYSYTGAPGPCPAGSSADHYHSHDTMDNSPQEDAYCTRTTVDPTPSSQGHQLQTLNGWGYVLIL